MHYILVQTCLQHHHPLVFRHMGAHERLSQWLSVAFNTVCTHWFEVDTIAHIKIPPQNWQVLIKHHNEWNAFKCIQFLGIKLLFTSLAIVHNAKSCFPLKFWKPVYIEGFFFANCTTYQKDWWISLCGLQGFAPQLEGVPSSSLIPEWN